MEGENGHVSFFSTIEVPTCGARMKYKLEVVQVRDGCRLQVYYTFSERRLGGGNMLGFLSFSVVHINGTLVVYSVTMEL